MQALLMPIILWLLSSVVARVLLGAGLGIGSYVILEPLFNDFLASVVSSFNGLMPDIAAFLWMAGAGQGISAILSALIARMSIQFALVFVGKTS